MVSWQMRAVFKDAEQFAQSALPLCIEGEVGVGKQLIAQSIHRRDALADASFIRFACAELQEARPGSEPVRWRKSGISGNGCLPTVDAPMHALL